MTRADEIEIVRASLQHYAARGAFRSFSEVQGTGRKAEFHFLWFRDIKFRLVYDPDRRTLTFVDFLPAVPARSAMDRHLRVFVTGRTVKSVPEHRRVDLKKMSVSVANRKGAMSIACTLKPGRIEYGAKKSVHLVHEVLMDFLNEPQYVQYNVDHFNLNPEMA